MNLTIHTTDLDSWAWFKKLDNMTTQEMIGRLLRTEPPNRKMQLGTTWHSIMENPPEEFSKIVKDGITFQVDCDATITLPQCREVRANKVYSVNGYNVTVTGKCDGITGNKLYDHKLTFNPNPETYLDSLQWRSYMDIFNADIFEYIVYAAKEEPDGTILIRDISTMTVYRYPEMISDLESAILELTEFIQFNVPQMIRA